MPEFPYHTPETAPADARDLLKAAKRQFGIVPNLYAKMAETPALLRGVPATLRSFRAISPS